MKKEEYKHMLRDKDDYKIWDVLIREGDFNFIMPVYRRSGIEHDHGKMNNCNPEYWLLRDRSALGLKMWEIDPENKEGRYRKNKGDLLDNDKRWQWVPWGDKFAKPVHWGFTFETYNKIDHYTKYNSDDYSVETSGFCRIFCNGREVYHFVCRDMEFMIFKARELTLRECGWGGIDPWDPDKVIGRKVWYHDQEGVVVKHFLPDDRVVIKSERPDGKGFNLTKKRDQESDWPVSEWNGAKEVHTGIFDSDIYWYRN